MSTSPMPGQPVQPASGWFPSLKGSGLPAAAINGITQGFSLIYSLRDTVNQQSNTIQKLVQYDTHMDRIQTRAQSMPDCMLWFESDRPTVFYQTRLKPQSTTRDWYYAGGIYYQVWANRPTDLDERDFGFLLLTAVSTPATSEDRHLYAWNGKDWDLVL